MEQERTSENLLLVRFALYVIPFLMERLGREQAIELAEAYKVYVKQFKETTVENIV